jgi:GT2 family glycosyltransferase
MASRPGGSGRAPADAVRRHGGDWAVSPSVAAVIVNYRTKKLTRAAVASVLSEPDVAEVVVVDNGSGDGSLDYLRESVTDDRVTLVDAGWNRGFGQGVNLGVANSRSPLILILNSDATVMAGSIAVLRHALTADDGVGVVAPAIYCEDGYTLQPGAFGRLPKRSDIVLGRWSKANRVRPAPDEAAPEWVSGVAMLVRRDDFTGVGGFDERFNMYFEDLDLCRRLRHLGKVAHRQAAAAVVHLGGRSWQSRTDQRERFQQSKLTYFQGLGASDAELRYVRVMKRIRTGVARKGVPHAEADSEPSG